MPGCRNVVHFQKPNDMDEERLKDNEDSVEHLFRFFLSSVPEGTDKSVVLRAAILLASVIIAKGGCSEELVYSAQVLLVGYSHIISETMNGIGNN